MRHGPAIPLLIAYVSWREWPSEDAVQRDFAAVVCFADADFAQVAFADARARLEDGEVFFEFFHGVVGFVGDGDDRGFVVTGSDLSQREIFAEAEIGGVDAGVFVAEIQDGAQGFLRCLKGICILRRWARVVMDFCQVRGGCAGFSL